MFSLVNWVYTASYDLPFSYQWSSQIHRILYLEWKLSTCRDFSKLILFPWIHGFSLSLTKSIYSTIRLKPAGNTVPYLEDKYFSVYGTFHFSVGGGLTLQCRTYTQLCRKREKSERGLKESSNVRTTFGKTYFSKQRWKNRFWNAFLFSSSNFRESLFASALQRGSVLQTLQTVHHGVRDTDRRRCSFLLMDLDCLINSLPRMFIKIFIFQTIYQTICQIFNSFSE